MSGDAGSDHGETGSGPSARAVDSSVIRPVASESVGRANVTGSCWALTRSRNECPRISPPSVSSVDLAAVEEYGERTGVLAGQVLVGHRSAVGGSRPTSATPATA
jgi:hypothetical protein